MVHSQKCNLVHYKRRTKTECMELSNQVREAKQHENNSLSIGITFVLMHINWISRAQNSNTQTAWSMHSAFLYYEVLWMKSFECTGGKDSNNWSLTATINCIQVQINYTPQIHILNYLVLVETTCCPVPWVCTAVT